MILYYMLINIDVGAFSTIFFIYPNVKSFPQESFALQSRKLYVT